jgi:hypothetical protein
VESAGKAQRIAGNILAYLVEHPDAKDSLQGIRLWWIDKPNECSDQDLREAAEVLVERGLLRTWQAAPGSVVYGPSAKFLEAPGKHLREFTAGRGKKVQ